MKEKNIRGLNTKIIKQCEEKKCNPLKEIEDSEDKYERTGKKK